MQYDKSVPGFGLGDIPYCLKVGKATAPTTWAFSLAYGDGTPGGTPQEEKGYHCWAEFYAPGAGWVPVDIAEARKHPELKDYFFGGLSGNRILFTPRATRCSDVPGVEWSLRYTDKPATRTAAAG